MSREGVSEPARTSEHCRYCWMCRHVCPVGRVTAREAHTPHAWALVIESVRRGQIDWTGDGVDVMFACADCGLCQTHCVTDQPLPDAIANARAEIVARGAAPAAVGDIAERLQRYANLHVPRVPKPGGLRGRTALFVGDADPASTAEVVEAARQLLAAAGVADVVLVGEGRSSGALASSLGLETLARSLAREVVDEVVSTGATEVLALTAADQWAFTSVYPTRLGVSWPEAIAVVEVMAVLARAHAEGRLTFRGEATGGPYAYHDPCHAPRVRRDHRAPRVLLAAACGESGARELFWREDRAHPCGALGGLPYTHPAIADALGEARIRDVHASGARRLVTEDPACAAHLTRHAGSGVAVVGLYPLLARQLAG